MIYSTLIKFLAVKPVFSEQENVELSKGVGQMNFWVNDIFISARLRPLLVLALLG